MAASCAASEPTYAKARPSVGASRYETATIAPGCSVSGSTSQQHPAESQQPACRAAGSYCYLPTAHLRRVRHAEAKVDRHIAEDAKHADASVLQLRLRADTHASGQVDAASSSRPVGGGGGEPTSRDHLRGTVLERSSGSKPLSPGRVPSSAGAASRKGIASDFFCQETGWGCVKPVAPALYCYRGEPPERSRG